MNESGVHPQHPPDEAIAQSKRSWLLRSPMIRVLFVALWAAAILFRGLGDAHVYIANEAREGVYARAMLSAGDFVLPEVPNHVENNAIIPDKPPLFHWLASIAAILHETSADRGAAVGPELAANFDEWMLRFPSALSGCLLAVAIVVLAPALIGERAAFFAAASLITSWQFIFQARFGRVDMTLSCFVTIAMLFAGRALIHGSRWALLAAASAAGFAVLAKGPLGIVLPGIACTAYLVLARRRAPEALHRLFSLPWLAAVAVFLAVTLPWYAAAIVAGGGDFLRSQLLTENLRQLTGGNGWMKLSYYLVPWFTDSLPWNLVAVCAVIHVRKARRPGADFLAVWWIAFLVFFHLAAYKRRAYILPALPAEVLLAGWILDSQFLPVTSSWLERWFAEIPRVSWRALLLCSAASVIGAVLGPIAAFGRLAGTSLSPLNGALALGGVAVALTAAHATSRCWQTRKPTGVLVSLWVLLTALYAGPFEAAWTVVSEADSPKILAARIEEAVPANESVTFVGVGNDSTLPLLFYLKQPKRASVVPDEVRPLRPYRPGFYLFSEEEWRQALREDGPEGLRRWRRHFVDDLRLWRDRLPVVLAELRKNS